MPLPELPRHDGLQQATRIGWLRPASQALPALEWTALLLFGGLATCVMVYWDWGLRVPGHAIMRAVFPMACGLALVPRRGAGVVMGAGALGTLLGMQAAGLSSPGWGATTSLLLTGPLMDAALWRTRPGRRMYWNFALAGLLSNMTAFAVKAGTKLAALPDRARTLGGLR